MVLLFSTSDSKPDKTLCCYLHLAYFTYYSTLKMEAVLFPEMSVNFCQNIRYGIQKDSILNITTIIQHALKTITVYKEN
jgi:hypothetical protein